MVKREAHLRGNRIRRREATGGWQNEILPHDPVGYGSEVAGIVVAKRPSELGQTHFEAPVQTSDARRERGIVEWESVAREEWVKWRRRRIQEHESLYAREEDHEWRVFLVLVIVVDDVGGILRESIRLSQINSARLTPLRWVRRLMWANESRQDSLLVV